LAGSLSVATIRFHTDNLDRGKSFVQISAFYDTVASKKGLINHINPVLKLMVHMPWKCAIYTFSGWSVDSSFFVEGCCD